MTWENMSELREELEKNGIAWSGDYDDNGDTTAWKSPRGQLFNCGHERFNHDLCLHVSPVTAKQAIAATLGRPKVKKVRGMTYDEHGGEVYYLACSGCRDWVDGDLDCIGEQDGPNFCHNCGGEFDGPLMCKVCGKLADMEFGDMCAECYWHEGEGNDVR